MDLPGKVAVITGAARGIGKAYTQALLHKGCKVCMSDINADQGRETCKELQKQFGADNVIFVKCDVTSTEQVQELMRAAVEKFRFVEIMVNNAGLIREDAPFFSLDVNLNGVIRGMTVAMEHMRRDRGGRGGVIINTSSMAVFMSPNSTPAYTAAKWGIVGYSKSWAAHPDVLNNGIRIVCICPAIVDTEIFNIKEEQVKGKHLFDAGRSIMKSMSVNDVARALIKVLEDNENNGSCLKVEYPDDSEVTMTYTKE